MTPISPFSFDLSISPAKFESYHTISTDLPKSYGGHTSPVALKISDP
jgi:hypothetical protein